MKRKSKTFSEDSSSDISEQDLDFIKEFGNSSFLINSIEENYEYKTDPSFKELLPIKLKDGSLKFIREQVSEDIPNTDAVDALDALVAVEAAEPNTDAVVAAEAAQEGISLEGISRLALQVLENPRLYIKNLEILLQCLKDSHKEEIIIKTLVLVFKDLIPSYKIVQFSLQENCTKQVKDLRNFELHLLKYYQDFLKFLDKSSLKELGLKCFVELVQAAKYFNFRNNLLAKIIHFTGSNSKKLVDISSDCISSLFKQDFSGEISLEIVKGLASLIKKRNYKISQRVLYTFLDLRLIQEFSQKKDAKEDSVKKGKEHISRKSRKIMKYNAEIQNELKEAEAEYNKEEKKKHQSDTLKFVFATYFRILKNAPSSLLLEAVLQGLAKFAHLINVEFFNDLLNVLKKISNDHFQAYLDGDDKSITRKNSLHCVIAAFQLLSGQGAALNIDLADFYKSFYSQMISVILQSSSMSEISNIQESDLPSKKSELGLLLHGFELMFDRKKSMPLERVAAFVKRLATASLYMPRNAILASLSIIKSLMVKFPKLDIMFDPEGTSNAVYSPFLDDPDLSHACATNMWELTQLKTHYDPLVRSFVDNIIEMTSTRYQTGNTRPRNPELSLKYSTYLSKYDIFLNNGHDLNISILPSPELVQFLKKKKTKGIKCCDGPTGLNSFMTFDSVDSELVRFRDLLHETFHSLEKELGQLRLSKLTSDKIINELESKITSLEASNIQKSNHIEDLKKQIDKFQSFKKSIQATLESQDENRNPFSDNSDPQTTKSVKFSIDGRSFFSKARSVLNYDDYTSLIHLVKQYNEREQSSSSTLKESSLILSRYPDLFKEFERLLLNSKIST